jgi:hypothetical protein
MYGLYSRAACNQERLMMARVRYVYIFYTFCLNAENSTALITRVSVQGVNSLGSHFACLCREFDFYDVKKIVIIFQKEKENTFTLLIIFIVQSLQKEQKSTNILLALICRNKPAITLK